MKLEEIKYLRALLRKQSIEVIYDTLSIMIASREFPTIEMIIDNVLSKVSELANHSFKKAINDHGSDFVTILFRGPEPNYNCEMCKKILDPPDERP